MNNESIYYVLHKSTYINVNHTHPSETSTRIFFTAKDVSTFMLGRKFNNYIILKQNENEARVFSDIERDVFKLEQKLEEF